MVQRPDPAKRNKIAAAAGRLFAVRPYHEVTLDAVAAAAKVGKGTLYVYFRSKEELYGALIDDGFGELLADLRARLDDDAHGARAALRIVVQALLEHAQRFPHLFQLMRAGEQLPCALRLAARRTELMELVLGILRRGVRCGELRDAQPRLTAAYLPSLVRAAVLYGPAELRPAIVADHILAVICGGIERGAPVRRRRSRTAAQPRRIRR